MVSLGRDCQKRFFKLSDNESLKNDANFQNQWFKNDLVPPPGKKKISPVQQNLEAIKAYAYGAFDKIDANGNGYIERDELLAVFEDDSVSMKDKSFIMFLLNNQKEIADSAKEGSGEQQDGISRLDLEMYFKIVIGRLSAP